MAFIDRRELLTALSRGSVAVAAGSAMSSLVPAWVEAAPQGATRPGGGSRPTFMKVPLANGIIPHAGATAMELYHRHPHDPREEIVQPEDIRLQTRLTIRNHKESLDWMGLGWANVVKLTRYQTRMDETKQIDEVLRSYFKDWRPAQTIYEVSGLSSPQARLEIDMWVAPRETRVQSTPGTIRGIDPIAPRPEVTDRQAFALAVKVSPDFDLVFFSAITPHPPEADPWNPGSFRVPDDPDTRSRLATENLDRLLKAGGMTWEHIIFNVNWNAPGGGGIDFNARYGDWRPCSTSLRVTDTGIPGANVLYQITAAAPHRPITMRGLVPGVEPILHRPGVTLKELPLAPAIRVTRDVDLVYFPGVTAYPLDVDPWNPGSHKLPDDAAAQEKMVADNIDRMLKAAGITWQHIILMTRVGEVKGLRGMQDRLGDWRPCRTTRAVSTGIPGARVMVEITAVAPRRT
jgi:enamine deaminase RidA (YjgF/YER057c/UK114 family)